MKREVWFSGSLRDLRGALGFADLGFVAAERELADCSRAGDLRGRGVFDFLGAVLVRGMSGSGRREVWMKTGTTVGLRSE